MFAVVPPILEGMRPTSDRPIINEYKDPADFVRDMLHFRKNSEAKFSITQASKGLRRVSPTLVTLVLQRKRKVTLDRVDEFAKLLDLTTSEKVYFRNWLGSKKQPGDKPVELACRVRKDVGTHILNDWVNVYVKDCFQIPEVQKNPSLIFHQLGSLVSQKRIDKSIKFLLSQGHLRKALDGTIILDTPLAAADPKISSAKIRRFHKRAFEVAKIALDSLPTTQRFSTTLVVPLNEKNRLELLMMVQEFDEKLQDFAARQVESGDRLYQMILNLSPVGGKLK